VNGAVWSPRVWALPWALAGLAILQLSLAAPSPVPGVVAAILLVWIPLRRKPLRLPAYGSWILALPFAAWWIALAASGRASPLELVAVPGWYLGLSAVVQVLGGRGGSAWCPWNALAATMLVGFRPDLSQGAVAALLGVATLAHLRMLGASGGGSAFRASWIAAAAGVVLATSALSLVRVNPGWGGAGSWDRGAARKGFSASLRLGAGFGIDPDPGEDEVALRVWSDRPPTHVKGAVFDVYVRGGWSRAEPWTVSASSRALLDFQVYCLVSDTMGPPLGWARGGVGSDSRLLVPPEAGCVGAVADSLPHSSAGEWKHPDEEIGRGWMWFSGAVPQTVRPAERRVPAELEGLLDSSLAEAVPAGTMTDSVPRAVSRWFGDRFRYRLDVPDPGKAEPLRAFLADRAGFCEHFATAGALMARRAGLPARVVTGYAWPEFSAGAWVFRRSHAHAWVEVFLPGRGWKTWDPTPGSDEPPAPRPVWHRWIDDLGTRASRLWHAVRDGAWRGRLEDATDRTSRAPLGRIALVALLVLLPVGFVVWRRRRRRAADASASRRWRERLARAEDRLRREGWVRGAGETVGAFLARLPPDVVPQARTELELYQSRRWKAGAD